MVFGVGITLIGWRAIYIDEGELIFVIAVPTIEISAEEAELGQRHFFPLKISLC